MGKKDFVMLKVENIGVTQGLLDIYSKGANTDVRRQQNNIKDTYTPTAKEEDKRYSFDGLTVTENNKKRKYTKPVLISENLPAGAKFVINAKNSETEKPNFIDTEFSGDLTYQLLQNINKDIQKQIEILNKYNLSKVNRLIKTINPNI